MKPSIMRCFLILPVLPLIGSVIYASERERYNIIAILTDDQAVWTVGAYGYAEVHTPHINRLATEGALFQNAFVSTPVCSPSRVSFLTGLFGTQVGITDFLSRPEEAAGLGLPSATVTWPEVLQQHGYSTALIGKWHLGTLPQFHPTKHGFDHFYGWLRTPKSVGPVLEIDGRNQQVKGALPDLLTDEALRFIRNHREGPFSVLINYLQPHHPYGPVQEVDNAVYRDLDPTIPVIPGQNIEYIKDVTRRYYASVHAVDRNLGRILEELDSLGLSRKSIVLFTSDHGYQIGHHLLHGKGNANWSPGSPLRPRALRAPRRPNMFEESIRIPLLIRWPEVVKPGTRIPQTVSNVDTFASILGMLNIPIPEAVQQHGADFSPLLRGQDTPWRDTMFGQYDLHNGGLAYMRMIRTDEWKLVRHYKTYQLDELYNLKDDRGEMNNLYSRPGVQKVREQLLSRLESWMRSIDDPLLSTD